MDALGKLLEFVGISQTPQVQTPMMSAAPATQGITQLLNSKSTNMLDVTGAQASPVIPGQTGAQGNWLDGAFGGKDAWGPQAANAAAGLLQALVGWQGINESARQFDQTFDFQKSQYNTQANLANSSLADRQASRIAADGNRGTYQSVGDYMDKYGVKQYG